MVSFVSGWVVWTLEKLRRNLWHDCFFFFFPPFFEYFFCILFSDSKTVQAQEMLTLAQRKWVSKTETTTWRKTGTLNKNPWKNMRQKGMNNVYLYDYINICYGRNIGGQTSSVSVARHISDELLQQVERHQEWGGPVKGELRGVVFSNSEVLRHAQSSKPLRLWRSHGGHGTLRTAQEVPATQELPFGFAHKNEKTSSLNGIVCHHFCYHLAKVAI